MTQHTPGPWKIFDGYGADRRRPIIVDCIPDVDGKCIANSICYMSSTNENITANAQLIAAAPELLEALQAIVQAAGNCKEYVVFQKRAEAAIAKAIGNT